MTTKRILSKRAVAAVPRGSSRPASRPAPRVELAPLMASGTSARRQQPAARAAPARPGHGISPENTMTQNFNPFGTTVADPGHGRHRPHLRAAATSSTWPTRRDGQPYPMAGHQLHVGRWRQVDHLRDPPGREVERRPADDPADVVVHLPVRASRATTARRTTSTSPACPSPRRVTASGNNVTRDASRPPSTPTCRTSPAWRSCPSTSGRRSPTRLHLHRRQAGRHRPVHAGQLHPRASHGGEPVLLGSRSR